MNTYLITYETGVNTSESQLTDKIKTFPSWARTTRSVWLIKTLNSTREVFNYLKPYTSPGDKLLVIEVTQDWISINFSDEVVNWMRS